MLWRAFGFKWFNIFKDISLKDWVKCRPHYWCICSTTTCTLHLKSSNNLQLKFQKLHARLLFHSQDVHLSKSLCSLRVISPFLEKNWKMTATLCGGSLQHWTMLMWCSHKCRNTGSVEKCQETQMRFINQHSAHETSNYSFKTAAWGKQWPSAVSTIQLMQLLRKVHKFEHF